MSDDLDAFSPEDVWALAGPAGSKQDAALFLTAALTGLGMGEVLALEWWDVDFAGDAIRCPCDRLFHDLSGPRVVSLGDANVRSSRQTAV